MYRFNQLSESSKELAAQDFIEYLDEEFRNRDEDTVPEVMLILEKSEYLFKRDGTRILTTNEEK